MFFARKSRDAALKSKIDALGEVREQLRILKAREEELQSDILTYRPNEYVTAGAYELRYRLVKKRVFQKDALPAHILEDPAFWHSDTKPTLTLTPLDSSMKERSDDLTSDTYERGDYPIEHSEQPAFGSRASPDPTQMNPPLGTAAYAGEMSHAAEPAAAFDFSDAPRHGRNTPSK